MVESGTAGATATDARSGFVTRILDIFVDVIEPTLLWFSPGKRFVAVETGENDFAFYRTSKSRMTFLGRSSTLGERERRLFHPKPHHDVELRLHADSVILTTLKVPAEGLAYVEQIVESRLDRMTPWKPDQLLYGFEASSKPGPDRLIDVNFAATSHDIGASSIARLETLGVRPSRIGSAAEPVEQRLRIDLLRGENDAARQRRRGRAATIAIAVPLTVLLAFTVSTYFAFESSRRLTALDTSLSATRSLLVTSSGDTAAHERDIALLNEKTSANARFVMIDRLATIIPDSTFLEALDIDNDTIRIAGTSTEASALIEILSSEAAFSDAKFVAPVTRQDDGRDRFDITATRAGQPPEAAP